MPNNPNSPMFANILDIVQGKLGPVSGEVLQWLEATGREHYTVWDTTETQTLLVNLLTGNYRSKNPKIPFNTAYIEVRGILGPGHELSVDLDTKNWYTPDAVIKLEYPVAIVPKDNNISNTIQSRQNTDTKKILRISQTMCRDEIG